MITLTRILSSFRFFLSVSGCDVTIDMDMFNITVIRVSVMAMVAPVIVTDETYMATMTTKHLSVAVTGFHNFNNEEIQFFVVETLQSGIIAYK